MINNRYYLRTDIPEAEKKDIEEESKEVEENKFEWETLRGRYLISIL